MNKRVKLIFNSFFFLIVFILIYKVVNPQLIFHFQQLGFMWDSYLLNDYLSFPGGIIEYISSFIFQFASSRWLGALTCSLLIICVSFLTGRILEVSKKSAIIILKFTPVIILGLFLADYSFPIVYLINIIFLLIFILIYKSLLRLKLNPFVIIFLVFTLMSLAYYTIGGFAFLVFVLSILIYDLVSEKRKSVVKLFAILILGMAIPIISARYIFFISESDAYLQLEPFLSSYKWNNILYVLFLSVPILIILQKVFSSFPSKWKGIKVFQIIQYVVVFSVFSIFFLLNHNNAERNKNEIDRYAYNGEWEKIIESVNKKPSNDRLINFQTNRALFHLGKLPTEMFNYPQEWGIDGLFLTRHFMNEILLPSTQLFNELGYMNEAIHWGNEAISQKEYSPQILQELIKSHIIDGNYDSALLYINNLKNFPFFKRKAIEFEQMIIEDNPSQEMLRLRGFIPTTNFIVSRMSINLDLESMLDDHPNNKMVYEYLMAYYLLNNDLFSFYRNFPKGEIFNYDSIPRIYQEALVSFIYELNRKGRPVPEIKIDNEVLGDFSEYLTILSEFDGNLEVAKEFLMKYKNTYWFYLHYNSPVTNKRQIVVE